MAEAPGAFVVDASVTAAWFLPDEATSTTEDALQATITHDVWVPALWSFETVNLLLGAERRKRISRDKRVELIAAAAALRIRVDREPVTLERLATLAAGHALTAYDAAYLELALRRALPLASKDKALRVAMDEAHVVAWSRV